MAAGRSLWSRRRRADEEGEDDEGSVMVDSQSEGTALSDLGDDEAVASSVGEPGAVGGAEDVTANGGEGKTAGRKRNSKKRAQDKQAPAVVSSQPQFGNIADTEAMINGLSIKNCAEQEVVDFESMHRNGSSGPAPAIQATTSERKIDSPPALQRREHEEYRRKRDADPAFIPNRGNFFMHDTRTHNGAANPAMRGNGRGRGRGGAGVAGPFAPAGQSAQVERSAELPWKHDLHDTINEEPGSGRTADALQDQQESALLFSNTSNPSHHQTQPTKRSFSSTTLVGKVQIRVVLPGMKAPITFSEVPWKHYTRLPDHRPPLRRDKPVRVFLPPHVQRYIFPSPERSFIFIPRQMRPNQQGFGGRYQRSIGGYGYSSRRTSMYGGSMYAASVAASRRSSFASVARESAFSPVGSYAGGIPPTRPIVRLPHGSQSHFSTTSTPMGPLSGHQTPTGMGMHTYPLPAQPQYQGTPTTTVHQPKPQKAISVTGIESPAVLQQAAPPQESHPFANQLPAHLNGQPQFQQLPPAYFSPRQSFSYPNQPQSGTPLSGIPEQMNAPPFQPQMMPYAPGPYYPPYQQHQQGYYYPPGSGGYPSMSMFIPPPQNYMMSPPGPAMAPPPQQATPQQQATRPVESEPQQASQAQSGMVAHESNGMVFYMPASEAQQQNQGENYQPAEGFVPSYAMPGLPPPTPAPETAYYYPTQMPMSGYYPAQAPQQ